MPITQQAGPPKPHPIAAIVLALVTFYGSAVWASVPDVASVPRPRDATAELAQAQVVRPPGTEVPPPRPPDQPGIGSGQREVPEVVRPPSTARRPADAPAIGVPETPDAQAQPPRNDEPVGRPHQCVAGPPGAICN